MKLNTTIIKIQTYVLVLLLLLPLQVRAQQPTPSKSKEVSAKLVKQLTSIAEEAILAQNEVLVSGDVVNSLKTKTMSKHYQKAMQKQFDDQIEMRNALKRTRQEYKSVQTKIKVGDVIDDGSKITLVITEHAKLKLDVQGGPDFTEYEQDYIFEFSNVNGQWDISKVSEVPIGSPTPKLKNNQPVKPNNSQPIRHSEQPTERPTTHAPQGYIPSISLHARPADYPNGSMFLKTNFPAISSAPLVSGTYDAGAAVRYAHAFALTPNYVYGHFSNDCTDFVSQCVYQGGWPQVGNTDRANNSNWYYWCVVPLTYVPIASYSWAAAWNFNEFILGANRVFHRDYFQDMILGDLLFADWNNVGGNQLTPDGRVDHVMIVTMKDSSNQIYLSYHSPFTKDLSLSSLQLRVQQQGRTANFFGDGMRTSF